MGQKHFPAAHDAQTESQHCPSSYAGLYTLQTHPGNRAPVLVRPDGNSSWEPISRHPFRISEAALVGVAVGAPLFGEITVEFATVVDGTFPVGTCPLHLGIGDKRD